MKLLKLDSISKKIFCLVSVIVITSLVGISMLNYYISKRELSRSNQIILSNAIESTMVEINRNYGYAQNEVGWMTEEDAKLASLASIGDLTGGKLDGISGATEGDTDGIDGISSATLNSAYADHKINLGESGYFFITDSKGNIVSHPFLTDNIYNLESHDNRYIVQELINMAKSGGDFKLCS